MLNLTQLVGFGSGGGQTGAILMGCHFDTRTGAAPTGTFPDMITGTWSGGKNGQIKFGGPDGVASDISVSPVSSARVLSLNVAHSAEAWFYITNDDILYDVTIAVRQGAVNILVALDYNSGNCRVGLDTSAITGSSGSTFGSISGWHHLAYSHDGTTLRGFLDGALRHSIVCSNPFSASTSTTADIVTTTAGAAEASFDEFAVLDGAYIGDFTPNSAPYP